MSRVVGRPWRSVYALNPSLVGGCRPFDLNTVVAPDWHILHREMVCRFGICSEVLIAS